MKHDLVSVFIDLSRNSPGVILKNTTRTRHAVFLLSSFPASHIAARTHIRGMWFLSLEGFPDLRSLVYNLHLTPFLPSSSAPISSLNIFQKVDKMRDVFGGPAFEKEPEKSDMRKPGNCSCHRTYLLCGFSCRSDA